MKNDILDTWRKRRNNGLYITKKNYKIFCELEDNYKNEFDNTIEESGFIIIFKDDNPDSLNYLECDEKDTPIEGDCTLCYKDDIEDEYKETCNIINFNKLLREKKLERLL